MKKEASLLGNKDLFCSFYKEPFGIILKLRLFALSLGVLSCASEGKTINSQQLIIFDSFVCRSTNLPESQW